MAEIIKDYSKNEIEKGISSEMAREIENAGKIDLRHVAQDRRKKVRGNILTIKQDIEEHGRFDKDTKSRFEELNKKYNLLRDYELPKLEKEFAIVRNLYNIGSTIETYAIKLDRFEDEVLDILRPIAELKYEEKKFFEGKGDKDNFDDVCGRNLKRFIKSQDQDNSSLVLNSGVNTISINDVLQKSSLSKWKEFRRIDYSECKNESIKSKVIDLLGGKESCYIQYSPDTDTYNLYDYMGNKLQQKALLREGVKLYPPYLIKWEAKQNIKKMEKESAMDKMRNLSQDKIKELRESIPDKLKKKLNLDQQNEFIQYTENVLNSCIITARKNGEQLDGDPVRLSQFTGEYVELRTNTTHNRHSYPLLPNDHYKISENLQKILIDDKRSVQKYLASRAREKRIDAEYFANKDIIQTESIKDDKELGEKEITNFLGGIDALLGMLGNYKPGVSRQQFDLFDFSSIKDKPLAGLESFLYDLRFTIESGSCNTSLLLKAEQDISSRLKVCGFKYDSSKNSGKTIENFVKTILESDDKERQIALRRLGETTNWVRHDTSLSSDQLRYTAMNIDNVKIKDEEYNECFQKIKEYFTVGENADTDGDNKCEASKNIDELYKCSSGVSVYDFFRRKKIIPAKGEYSDFKDVCENIYKKIESDNKKMKEQEQEMKNNSKKRLDNEYNRIRAKDSNDPVDIAFLNKYEYLSSPEGKSVLDEMINEIISSFMNNTKYLYTDSFLKGSLGLQLARSGDGLDTKGLSGAELNLITEFNDSIGAGGLFDFKDESVEVFHEILHEVVKEVIICAIVAVMTEGVGVGPRLAAKLPKWGVKIANRVIKGVAFHVASTLIHNGIDVINGDKVLGEMGEGLEDRKGYATSVMFFAVMELVPMGLYKIQFKDGKILKVLQNMEKAGKLPQGKTPEMIAKDLEGNFKGTIDLLNDAGMKNFMRFVKNAGVDIELFTTELTSMLLADQIGGLLTEGGFHTPSWEEITQTVGMILAFKGIGRIKAIIKGINGEKIFQVERSSENIIEISENEINGRNDEFDVKVRNKEGITIDGVTYKLEWHEGEVVYTEVGPGGRTTIKVKSDTFSLPEDAKGNRIREKYNYARQKYVGENIVTKQEKIRVDIDNKAVELFKEENPGEKYNEVNEKDKSGYKKRAEKVEVEARKIFEEENKGGKYDELEASEKAKYETRAEKIRLRNEFIDKKARELFNKDHPDAKYEERPKEQRTKYEKRAYIEYIETNFDRSSLEFRKGVSDKKKTEFQDKIRKKLSEMDLDGVDLDPINGTFRAFDGLEGFIKELAKGKMDQNFLNNINVTLDFMTEKIINVGESEPITRKEYKDTYKGGLKYPEYVTKAMEKRMIRQRLDNPQYFNSHGFDHTILVDSLILKVYNGTIGAKEGMVKKYGLDGKIAEELPKKLVRFSAQGHDFGYPEQIGKSKTTHATKGAEVFRSDIMPEVKKWLIDEGVSSENVNSICRDIYNSIFFHGADKVEGHYGAKVEGIEKGVARGGILIPKSKGNTPIEHRVMREYQNFENYRVSFKSENFRILSQKQALELSKGRNSDITIYTKEHPEGIKFKKIESKSTKREISEKHKKALGKEDIYEYEIEYENGSGIKIDDLIEKGIVTKIEGQTAEGKKVSVEIKLETQNEINDQLLNQAFSRDCDFFIETDKGRISYNAKTKEFTESGKVIGKEIILNEYKFKSIEVEGVNGTKIKGKDNKGKDDMDINYDEYEGRKLDKDDMGGAGLEYTRGDLAADPIMSMIGVADNLDMCRNRLLQTQSNAICQCALNNLETIGLIKDIYSKMEAYNKYNEYLIKLDKYNKGEIKEKPKEVDPVDESELFKIKEDLGQIFTGESIEISKIFEEVGHETGRRGKSIEEMKSKAQFKSYDENWKPKEYHIDTYFKDGVFDLAKFKRDLFQSIRDSGKIDSFVGEEILDMSRDLMGENMMGPGSVRHMVGLRTIESVDFVNGNVKIKVDMDAYFSSNLTTNPDGTLRMVNEEGVNVPLVEFHIFREGSALGSKSYKGQKILSYVTDGNNIIGNIRENGIVDYSPMFVDGTVKADPIKKTIDYSEGILKEEYKKYEGSPLFREIN